MIVDSYFTIERNAAAEFKDRGSKFLGYAFPISTIDEFKYQLQILKKEHAKGVHHCFAYRLGVDGNVFRSSDDGEPSGTAGKPILGQIDSKGITNVAIVVVRYFGGTLLGVPGLINAYKTTAAFTLQVVPLVKKQVEVKYQLQFDYTRTGDVMQLLKQMQATLLSQDVQLFCEFTIGVSVSRLDEFEFRLKELHGVSCKRH
jgi:uncharacterized YigZ family protein